MVGAFSRVRERIGAPRPIFPPTGKSRQNLTSNERFLEKALLVTRIATLRLVGIAPNAVRITKSNVVIFVSQRGVQSSCYFFSKFDSMMPHEKRSFLGRDALNFYLFIKIPRQNRCENRDRLFFLSTINLYIITTMFKISIS